MHTSAKFKGLQTIFFIWNERHVFSASIYGDRGFNAVSETHGMVSLESKSITRYFKNVHHADD